MQFSRVITAEVATENEWSDLYEGGVLSVIDGFGDTWTFLDQGTQLHVVSKFGSETHQTDGCPAPWTFAPLTVVGVRRENK